MNGLEVLFTPADFESLKSRDLTRSVCVVFDILRATSTMVTALSAGARAIFPCAGIREALSLHQSNPDFLLAGERNGLRIGAEWTGGVEFHLGNSPREFIPTRVEGLSIAMTTTNGTRAFAACKGASLVLTGAFLNLSKLVDALEGQTAKQIILVCGGTGEDAAFEDALAAGAVCHGLMKRKVDLTWNDSARMALRLFLSEMGDLKGAMRFSRNACRLLQMAALMEDVEYCLGLDVCPVLGRMEPDGGIRIWAVPARR